MACYLARSSCGITASGQGAKHDLGAILEKQIDLLLAGKTRADFPSAKPAPSATDRGAISGIKAKQRGALTQVPAAAPRTPGGPKKAAQGGPKPISPSQLSTTAPPQPAATDGNKPKEGAAAATTGDKSQ